MSTLRSLSDTQLEQLSEILLDSGSYLLSKHVWLNDIPAIKTLIKIGCDVNKQSPYYESCPLEIAVDNNNIPLINLLIENGATSKYSLNDTIISRKTEIFDILVKADIGLRPVDQAIEPLECAVLTNNIYMVKKLLESNIRHSSIEPAMTVAMRECNTEIMALLNTFTQ